MRPRSGQAWSVTILAGLIGLMACAPAEGPRVVDDELLVTSDGDSANWVTYGRTYSEHRFSPLSAINDGSVAQLGLVWSVSSPPRGASRRHRWSSTG